MACTPYLGHTFDTLLACTPPLLSGHLVPGSLGEVGSFSDGWREGRRGGFLKNMFHNTLVRA